jgi:regulator of protease activity HflC (stomatin/prohibitin superfamily)
MLFHPVVVSLVLGLLGGAGLVGFLTKDPIPAAAIAAVAVLLALTLRVAKQWQKAVVLRLGKYHGLKGPGLFAVLPLFDTITTWVDLRTVATPFNAEQTLTKDTVPMDVDAVLFWRVVDPAKAALELEYYRDAIFWAAQTALRDVIGKTELALMLSGRDQVDEMLRAIIDGRTEPWGIQVVSVEIRDVRIPQGLQDAMSMQAQADKEGQARIILAQSERKISEMFAESSRSYIDNPTALHLRAMSVLLEGMRHNSTVVVVPSSVVDMMGNSGAELLKKVALPPKTTI